jgi:hypothetical protein
MDFSFPLVVSAGVGKTAFGPLRPRGEAVRNPASRPPEGTVTEGSEVVGL